MKTEQEVGDTIRVMKRWIKKHASHMIVNNQGAHLMALATMLTALEWVLGMEAEAVKETDAMLKCMREELKEAEHVRRN